ncbi:hypothetical protein EJB05_44833, partial [Eragrostis curvula]
MQARALSVLILFLLATAFTPSASTEDAIGLASRISGNQTLVSAGKVFKLGFFSPDGADGRSYLGIWYASIPERTVVWVANRQSPVVDGPGVLELAADGHLVIADAKNATVWSSAAPTREVTSSAVARLEDSGNLVVMSSDGAREESVAWQSFDYPTDTLLPGMKLGVDIRAGITRNITSWRSPSDPSPGEYMFKLVIGGLPQFFLFRGPTTRIYTSGPWNGDILTGVPYLKSKDLSFEVVASPDETYYRYFIRDASMLSRFVIDGETGKLRRYQWSNGRWNSFWFYPNEPCEEYARCGAFGYCDSDRSPMCSCLPGFAPRSPEQWSRRVASGGCVRKAELSCGGDGNGDDGFWVVDRMKLPEATNATVLAGMNLDQCRQVCLNDCSCRAYSAANYSGMVGSGCVIWSVDLLDMRKYSMHVQDVYIRLARSEIDALKAAEHAAVHRRHPRRTVVLAVAATIAGVLLLLAVVFCSFWRNKVRRKPQFEMVSAAAPTGGARKRRLDADWKCAEKDGDLPLIDLEVIQEATNNFSVENKIGQGGFGPVYRGKLEDGLLVAVKRMSQKSSQGVEEFTNEVKVIAKLQHRNLVRLLGCCIDDDDERILVYEYMDNGSLDSFIFDEGKRKLLGWKKRFEIIMGIARGLLYLHEDSRFRIIHRDMKASNVLLDEHMVPKISDFGTARMCGCDETSVSTLKVIGTYGYMSPEYAMDGLFSLKSDVYSFGVLVIEIVTGKKNRGFYDPDHDLSLLGYAWMLWKEGRTVDLADEAMDGDFNSSEVRRCIQVALLCVDVLARNRPLMSSAVMMLASENAMIPEPNEPGVNIGRNTSDTDSTHGLTSNNATTTTSELDPR